MTEPAIGASAVSALKVVLAQYVGLLLSQRRRGSEGRNHGFTNEHGAFFWSSKSRLLWVQALSAHQRIDGGAQIISILLKMLLKLLVCLVLRENGAQNIEHVHGLSLGPLGAICGGLSDKRGSIASSIIVHE